MRAVVVAALILCACKRVQPARHIALPPGPAPVLDPSPNAELPKMPPLIEARTQGGIRGSILWQIDLWSDGTVGFSGSSCHGTFRATLPWTRVKELAEALTQIDFSHPVPVPQDDHCKDGYETTVVAISRRIERTNCMTTRDPALDNALDLIRTAVSTPPCDTQFLN